MTQEAKHQPKVSAEVLLRRVSGPGAALNLERVPRQLAELGLDILSVGKHSISIQGTPQQFEALFQCKLAPFEPAGGREARDFGPVQGPRFQAAQPPTIPQALQDAVESIEIQEPPLLL